MTPIELIHLQQRISGVEPYDPLYDFDCDGAITDAVEKAQWLDTWFNGVFPCASQAATASGGTTLTNKELEELAELAEWIASDMNAAGLAEPVVLVAGKANAHVGTPLGHEFGVLASQLASLR